ncbi:MAG: hypothetical protein P8Y02_07290 [Deinococcales bacterium]
MRITLRPVMKAAFEADVSDSPIVCVAKPANASTPSIMAGRTARRSNRAQLSSRPASVKRTASKSGTGMVWSASLITTKVVPQIRVMPTRAAAPTAGGMPDILARRACDGHGARAAA